MAARKKKSALAAQANRDASTDMSERGRGAKKANELNPNALHQLRAADDGYREGAIATFAENIATMKKWNEDHTTVGDPADWLLAELRRRFADHPDRIAHHLKLRGLA